MSADFQLKQMVGWRQGPGGRNEKVYHGSDEIYYNGQLVGQVTRHAACGIILYCAQNELVKAEVLRGVTALRKELLDGAEKIDWMPNGKVVCPPSDRRVEEAVEVILAQEKDNGADTDDEPDTEE